MSSTNYKQLISYMPTMAAVVNSFQSPEVQIVVFQRLIGALENALNMKPSAADSDKSSRPSVLGSGRNGSSVSGMEITHDLVEGDSIHSAIGE